MFDTCCWLIAYWIIFIEKLQNGGHFVWASNVKNRTMHHIYIRFIGKSAMYWMYSIHAFWYSKIILFALYFLILWQDDKVATIEKYFTHPDSFGWDHVETSMEVRPKMNEVTMVVPKCVPIRRCRVNELSLQTVKLQAAWECFGLIMLGFAIEMKLYCP